MDRLKKIEVNMFFIETKFEYFYQFKDELIKVNVNCPQYKNYFRFINVRDGERGIGYFLEYPYFYFFN